MVSASLQMTPCHPEGGPRKRRPRPVLKIPLPPSPWGPTASDLDVLVSDSIKAQAQGREGSLTPRIQQPQHMMLHLVSNPAAPPPSPAEGTEMSSRSPAFPSPRCSSESKRVVFSDKWTDDDGGSGRTSTDSERSTTNYWQSKGRVM